MSTYVTVKNTAGLTLVVTCAQTMYPTANDAAAATNAITASTAQTITDTTTYYFAAQVRDKTFSVKHNGREISSSPDGTARTLRLQVGQGTIIGPHYDDVDSYAKGAQIIGGYNAIGSKAADFTVDWSAGSTQSVTMTASKVVSFSGAAAGQVVRLAITQGGAGSFTVTWGSGIKFTAAAAPTLSTTAGKVDVLSFVYDGTNYRELSRSLNNA